MVKKRDVPRLDYVRCDTYAAREVIHDDFTRHVFDMVCDRAKEGHSTVCIKVPEQVTDGFMSSLKKDYQEAGYKVLLSSLHTPRLITVEW